MPDRRTFLRSTAAAATLLAARRLAPARGSDRLRVGLVGCGGRGSGAAANCVESSPGVVVHAMADLFRDRLEASLKNLAFLGDALDVPPERRFVGFDAYRRLLETDVDLVILATPPHFRPAHFEAAVEAGKHVFMEKPVATDPVGIRRVLAADRVAEEKGLSVVAGTQRRHQASYVECMRRVADGAIGRIVGGSCHWEQGGLWVRERRPEWSDMEWQVRNWLYFTWLSGDHIVEQHVHNIDVMLWALGPPLRAVGMGGRQVRTDPKYGNVFDHFAVRFEFPGGVWVTSTCRQIDGCRSEIGERIVGTEGVAYPSQGRIEGRRPWRFEGEEENPYVREHRDLVDAIRSGRPLREARQVAESTLAAIMGRMSAYTGQEVTRSFALEESRLDLSPPAYEFGDLPVAPVAVPGRTPLV